MLCFVLVVVLVLVLVFVVYVVVDCLVNISVLLLLLLVMIIVLVVDELYICGNQLGMLVGVLSSNYDLLQLLDQVLQCLCIDGCQNIVKVILSVLVVKLNDLVVYKLQIEFDNMFWCFDMSQNGKCMIVEEFDVWMKVCGVCVVKVCLVLVVILVLVEVLVEIKLVDKK